MFYIYADGKTIYQPLDETLSLIAPKLTLEVGKAGCFQFQLPPNQKYYDFFRQLSTIVTVELDDEEIFRGRVLTNNRNFNKIRTVYCEGDLAYLVDSVQKAKKFDGTAHELFSDIIASHNERVEASKRFVVGEVTIDDVHVVLSGKSDIIQDEETGEFDYNQIIINAIAEEWQNTYDFLETCLIDSTGGYLRTRHEDGVIYIDLLKNTDATPVQEIEFGRNLLDLMEENNPDDILTVLIPLGDENLTIESVNNGNDELVDDDAVSKYGRIVKTHVFDGVNNPETLLENAHRYLEEHSKFSPTITVKAVDMHLLNPTATAIHVGDCVRIVSAPHDMQDVLMCTKIEYDLNNPANNSYTFGTTNPSLTERYRKDKAKSSKGGGGGGGTSDVVDESVEKAKNEVFDAWINTNPESGTVSLGALYEKYTNDMLVLKNQVGIDLSAPEGNINIRTLHNELNEAQETIREQSAQIDIVNADLSARIDQVVANHNTLDNREITNNAEQALRITNLESAIDTHTTYILGIDDRVSTAETTINQLSNELQSQIDIEASYRELINEQLIESSASIHTLSQSLESQIKLEASHKSDLDSKIASIEVKADKNESSIRLKANKTYVDSEILSVTGKLESNEAYIANLESEIADVKKLIATEINSITLDTLIAKATIVSAPVISAGTSLTLAGSKVINQVTLNNTLSEYATKDWVESILESYSKTNHTHSWSGDTITDKPSTFPPSSHKHKFSTTYKLDWGHTHTTSTLFKPGNQTGGVYNYKQKELPISGTTNSN